MNVITYDREESVLRGQVPLLKFKVSFFNIQRRSKNSLHAESRNITEVVWKLIWENFVPFLGGIKAHQSIEIMRCIRESFITKTGRNTQFRFKISFFALKHLFHLRWKLKLFCIKTFGQVLIFLFVCVLLFIHVLAYLSQSLNCMSVSYPISSGICFWHTLCHRNHIFIYSSRIAELIFIKLDQSILR